MKSRTTRGLCMRAIGIVSLLALGSTGSAAQDSFGACMSEIECRDWSPDAYNPASTPCAEQWQQLGASEPC